ncbi:uncharacterized protein EAF01_010964 [Botrytis porri]|uniref:uncharacterized protein n=1 Tax=Botrytis porri TaxID=87229 RepID=UPI0018FF1C25|nr:uncharacterized protein EAF01_010964 [Botrytis porri]KAF7887810.1 hypothetical protein EAF01_010964 [Botrytis porri]
MAMADLTRLIQEAEKKKPRGQNAVYVAGYLGFQDKVVLAKWIEDPQHLPRILTPWHTAKQTAFGCLVKNPIKPSEKDFSTSNIFKYISSLNPRLISFVTGDRFPITHETLGLKQNVDDPGYLYNLHDMHLIITTYLDHFLQDTPKSAKKLHSRENWFRPSSTLRFYRLSHRKLNGSRTKSLPQKEAIAPFSMDSEVASIDKTINESTSYARFKQDEYNDLSDMENDGSISIINKTAEEIEEENVRETDEFHAQLNKSGNIQKEGNQRIIEGKKNH